MQSLKQILILEKHEGKNKGTSLQRRLFAFFAFMAVFLIILFVALLMLFNINGSGTAAIRHFTEGELTHLSAEISSDFGRLAAHGIQFSTELSANIESFCKKEEISEQDLENSRNLIEPLLAGQIQTMKNIIERNDCSGVFIILDTTVNPNLPNAENSRSGIFLKKTQPNLVDSVGLKLHYLRGPAEIAKENGIELMGQWKMEFDTQNQSFFKSVMQTAQNRTDLPLSRLYFWTNRISLNDDNELRLLLCIPIRSGNGTVFGICGIEVNDRLFKHSYSPKNETYTNVFSAACPIEDALIRMDQGMIAGNYYLTSARMEKPFEISYGKKGFYYYSDREASFGGLHTDLKLYPADSPYENQKWAVSVMMPKKTLEEAIRGQSQSIFIIVLVLFAFSLIASIFISRRYLRPVTDALNKIKSKNYSDQSRNPYLEINDLMEFLTQQDNEAKNQARAVIKPDDDIPMFEQFLENVKTLSKAEKSVFDLYIKGYKAQEIAEILHLSINTIKTHNRRIFSKLNVSNRKELIVYIDMMKEMKMI